MSGEHGTARHPAHVAFDVGKLMAFHSLPWVLAAVVIGIVWWNLAEQLSIARSQRDALVREVIRNRELMAESERACRMTLRRIEAKLDGAYRGGDGDEDHR